MSLTSKTIEAFFWSGTTQLLRQVFQFIITAILARLLSPTDFGIIGMALVFTSFITLFNEMGIVAGVVKEKNINQEELSSIFFINLGLGIFFTILTISLSSVIAHFYQKEIIKPIIILLSFNFFMGSFINVQQALFQKKLEFKKLTITVVFSLILSGSIGIFLAYKGFGVWSLVFQNLSLTLFRAIFLWLASSFSPKLVFSWQRVENFFVFSLQVLGYNIINFFSRNLDYLLIGKFLGAAPLGYYTLAYRLMLSPLRNVSNTIGVVLSPAFCEIQDNKPKIREAYLKSIQCISLVTFPMMLGLFAIAPEFVSVIYGSKWKPAIFVIRVLCFTGILQSIGDNIPSIFLSTSRADIQLKWSIVSVSLTCLAIIIGLNWGINGVAIAYTSIQFLLWLPSNIIANRLIDLKTRDFIASFFPISLISFIMLAIIIEFHHIQKSVLNLNSLYLMISSIVLGICCYLSLLLLFRIKIVNELIKMLKDMFNRKAS